tara:strand:+ start:3286 stop:4689 length:1404 start_codon:yes stop_codon:yes gene_type:complete
MKLIVLEINEISKKIIDIYLSRNKTKGFDRLNKRIKTFVTDLDEESIYPSQTWASINTGKSFNSHKTKWFSEDLDHNDIYWNQLAKQGKRVAIVGTLHSSPANKFLIDGHNFTTFIPDFFSSDDETYPQKYKNFQGLNIALTMGSRRAANRSLFKEAIFSFLKKPNLDAWGLNNLLAIKQLIKIIFFSIFGNKERLRMAQFTLSSSIFFNSLKKDKPDLGILFSNHIASMMHRYLHAHFYKQNNTYSKEWLDKYKKEVDFSIELLDEWIDKISIFAKHNGYKILVVSSMGQKINEQIDSKHVSSFQHDYVLKKPKMLLKKFFGEKVFDFKQLGVMAPQYAFEFSNEKEAKNAHLHISKVGTDRPMRYGHYTKNENYNKNTSGIYLNADLNKKAVTVTVQLHKDEIKFFGKDYTYKDLGFEKVKVDTHHSGEHDKEGLVWSDFDFSNNEEIDYLDFSDILKKKLHGNI